jgi:hypothetical protein
MTILRERLRITHPSGLLKNLNLRPVLGGAAIHRCDKWSIFNGGFSRCGHNAARKIIFQQPASMQQQAGDGDSGSDDAENDAAIPKAILLRKQRNRGDH